MRPPSVKPWEKENINRTKSSFAEIWKGGISIIICSETSTLLGQIFQKGSFGCNDNFRSLRALGYTYQASFESIQSLISEIFTILYLWLLQRGFALSSSHRSDIQNDENLWIWTSDWLETWLIGLLQYSQGIKDIITTEWFYPKNFEPTEFQSKFVLQIHFCWEKTFFFKLRC